MILGTTERTREERRKRKGDGKDHGHLGGRADEGAKRSWTPPRQSGQENEGESGRQGEHIMDTSGGERMRKRKDHGHLYGRAGRKARQ